jgi:hypothetical protein
MTSLIGGRTTAFCCALSLVALIANLHIRSWRPLTLASKGSFGRGLREQPDPVGSILLKCSLQFAAQRIGDGIGTVVPNDEARCCPRKCKADRKCSKGGRRCPNEAYLSVKAKERADSDGWRALPQKMAPQTASVGPRRLGDDRRSRASHEKLSTLAVAAITAPRICFVPLSRL